jgi:uncharacterized protein YjbJ (UPF0337 family)
MKKWILLVGAAIGFVFGSRAGREPYNRLEGKVREVTNRPEVQKAMGSVTKKAQDQVSDAVDTAHKKVSDTADTVHKKVSDAADKVAHKLPA